MCEDLVDSKAFFLDGKDGECHPVVISAFSLLMEQMGSGEECLLPRWSPVISMFLPKMHLISPTQNEIKQLRFFITYIFYCQGWRSCPPASVGRVH